MPRYIVKLMDGETPLYFEYSTVVDAPITYGLSLEEFREYYKDEYGQSGMLGLEDRLKRVEEKGTSSREHDSAEDVLSYNSEDYSIQQVIDLWLKAPPEGEDYDA